MVVFSVVSGFSVESWVTGAVVLDGVVTANVVEAAVVGADVVGAAVVGAAVVNGKVEAVVSAVGLKQYFKAEYQVLKIISF